MASKAHQLILGVIARRMRINGFEIVFFDGKSAMVSTTKLPIPPAIKKHRPDIIGINVSSKGICIGEAKTDLDLFSKRTKRQFTDYGNLFSKSNNLCSLIIGIPESSEGKLKELLKELDLLYKENISYIWIPDEFLNSEEDEV